MAQEKTKAGSKTRSEAAPKAASEAGYVMRRPGRPKKTEAVGDVAREGVPAEQPAKEEGESLRFEMRLPPGMVADLELMREHTGLTFASYIRRAVLRALEEDKKDWSEK